MPISKVAVIGAGVMGGGIAAHVANAGLPVVLLDIVPPGAKDRTIVAEQAHRAPAQDRSRAADASRFRAPHHARQSRGRSRPACRVRLDRRGGDRKARGQARHSTRKSRSARKPGSIVTSNTSTIPLKDLVAGMPESFAARLPHHPFLQPAALYAPARDRARAADPRRGGAGGRASSASAPRQGRGPCQGHARLHRQPHRRLCGSQSALQAAFDLGLSVEEADAVMGRPFGMPQAPASSACSTSSAST